MIINFAAQSGMDAKMTILNIRTEQGETLRKGDVVAIPLRSGSYIQAKVMDLQFWHARIPEIIEENTTAEIVVFNVPPNKVRTVNDLDTAHSKRYKNLTPYREIYGGDLSIYEHVQKGYNVSDKVIAYLKTTNLHMTYMGVYTHPFKTEVTLMGPEWYTDNLRYCWDRETWRYVKEYGLLLPQEFIAFVHSDVGEKYLRENT